MENLETYIFDTRPIEDKLDNIKYHLNEIKKIYEDIKFDLDSLKHK